MNDMVFKFVGQTKKDQKIIYNKESTFQTEEIRTEKALYADQIFSTVQGREEEEFFSTSCLCRGWAAVPKCIS